MAQITTNQHSYTNIAALLNVEATAIRTDVGTVSITANWNIYTAGSSYAGATRYLVLFIGSNSGTKYYSTAIGSNWNKQTEYKGSYTFTGIPLDADATEITIGFGVSGSNTSLSASGTLIWNGDAEVTTPTYDPDIQFNKITGIEKGHIACVYISDEAKNFERYICYICDEKDPKQPFAEYHPYVFDGTNWKLCV